MSRRTGPQLATDGVIQFAVAVLLAAICALQSCEAKRSLNQGGSEGQYGPVIDAPLVPVASALLPNGQVLTWSGGQVDHYAFGESGITWYAVFDPSSDTFGDLQSVNNAHDMFCPGIAMLANGDIAIVGGSSGEDGSGATSVWTGSAFEAGPAINIARGYNSAVTISTGRVFTLGGSFSGDDDLDKGAEIWNSNSDDGWRLVSNILGESIFSDDPDGMYRADNYGFFFAWTSNSVFHAGPSTQMNWFDDLADDGTTTSAGSRGATAMNGNAVMYAAGQIMVVGGAPSFSEGQDARTGAEVITIESPGEEPNVRSVPGPNIARTYSMAVVLPTGEVAFIGGAELAVEFSDDTAILQTEIWDPVTETFTLDASHSEPRTYHSSAVLIHDGRVFVGGGGLCGDCGINHLNAEMYSPPYLFNADGSAADRPSITLGATSAGHRDSISVTASETLSMVSMIRMGGATHSTNTDQRRVELCGPSTTDCSGDDVTVQIPNSGVAIVGYWMVFGVNEAGVPSVGENLQIT